MSYYRRYGDQAAASGAPIAASPEKLPFVVSDGTGGTAMNLFGCVPRLRFTASISLRF